MSNPMLMKLEQFSNFCEADRQLFDKLITGKRRTYPAKATILADGACTSDILLVLSGLAARVKDMRDGGRQIMAFLIPGDLCDVEVFVLGRMDHTIMAMTPTECAIIPAETMRTLLTDRQGLTQALWWSTMTDSAVLRERIVDHGRRDARERLAHLMYELLIRYRIVGMADGNAYPLALTQEELGEATGLTSVHVNRMLQSLRAEGLIEHRNRTLTVLDVAGLKRAARFDADYLHLKRTEEGGSDVALRAGDLL